MQVSKLMAEMVMQHLVASADMRLAQRSTVLILATVVSIKFVTYNLQMVIMLSR